MTELKKIRVAVVEDEIIIADHLCETLEELGYVALEPAISYTEAIELLMIEKPDMAILDIRLSGSKDGIDVAEKINSFLKIPFIFLTSNSDKATVDRAKKVRPSAFLVKPFTKEELYSSIEIAISNHEQKTILEAGTQHEKDRYVFVKFKNSFVKVFLESILYVKSDHIYVEMYTKKDKIVIRNSLNEFQKLLDDRFMRVHRSYIVNMDYVESVGQDSLVIDSQQIPVSTNNRKEVLDRLKM